MCVEACEQSTCVLCIRYIYIFMYIHFYHPVLPVYYFTIICSYFVLPCSVLIVILLLLPFLNSFCFYCLVKHFVKLVLKSDVKVKCSLSLSELLVV